MNVVVVTVLTDRDVLLGRGAPIAHYVGNVNFRKYIHTRKEEYASRSRHDHKQFIAQQIYDEVTHEWNGRFLAKLESSDIRRIALGIAATTKAWVIAPKEVALEKIKQALRDKNTPSSNGVPSWHSTAITTNTSNENQDDDEIVGNYTAGGGTTQSNATMTATSTSPATTVTGSGVVSTGANFVADPRPPPTPIALFMMQRQLEEAEQKRRQQQQQQQLLLLLLQQQQQQNSILLQTRSTTRHHHVIEFAAPPRTAEPTRTTPIPAAAGYPQLDLRNQLAHLNRIIQQQQGAGISNVETNRPPMNHKDWDTNTPS